MSSESKVKSAGDTALVLEPFIGPETPSHLESPEKQLEAAESRPIAPTKSSYKTLRADEPDSTESQRENEAPPKSRTSEFVTEGEPKASQNNLPDSSSIMASRHTEPAHQHTKSELMHPGREEHLSAQPCPDPSAHRDTKLQEQASSAALYVTKPHTKAGSREEVQDILDANNKLSSRSNYTRWTIREGNAPTDRL